MTLMHNEPQYLSLCHLSLLCICPVFWTNKFFPCGLLSCSNYISWQASSPEMLLLFSVHTSPLEHYVLCASVTKAWLDSKLSSKPWCFNLPSATRMRFFNSSNNSLSILHLLHRWSKRFHMLLVVSTWLSPTTVSSTKLGFISSNLFFKSIILFN